MSILFLLQCHCIINNHFLCAGVGPGMKSMNFSDKNTKWEWDGETAICLESVAIQS